MTHTQSAPAGPTETSNVAMPSSSGTAGEEDIHAVLDEQARRARRRLGRLIGVAATESNMLVPLDGHFTEDPRTQRAHQARTLEAPFGPPARQGNACRTHPALPLTRRTRHRASPTAAN